MNIDNLIETLINLKSQGAETINIVDSSWKDYFIENIYLSNKTIALVSLEEAEY